MKKLIGFSLMIMLLSFSINAQQNQRNFNKVNDFTPEQQAVLKAKKMALNFDLNTSQQKEVYNFMLQNAIDRKTAMAAMKPACRSSPSFPPVGRLARIPKFGALTAQATFWTRSPGQAFSPIPMSW